MKCTEENNRPQFHKMWIIIHTKYTYEYMYYKQRLRCNMLFFLKKVFVRVSVNLRTKTRVLFFEETIFFWNNSLYVNTLLLVCLSKHNVSLEKGSDQLFVYREVNPYKKSVTFASFFCVHSPSRCPPFLFIFDEHIAYCQTK